MKKNTAYENIVCAVEQLQHAANSSKDEEPKVPKISSPEKNEKNAQKAKKSKKKITRTQKNEYIDAKKKPKLEQRSLDSFSVTKQETESATPKSSTRKQKSLVPNIRITYTGLTEDQKSILWDTFDKIGDQNSTSIALSYDPLVTHIITASENGICPRTFKYMCAVLDGKWIVDFNWYLECITKNNWVSEEDYEIKGDVVIGRTNAPEKGRKAFLQKTLLFKGLKFYMIGEFSPPSLAKSKIQDLIKIGGGVLIPRLPNHLSRQHVVISDGSKDEMELDCPKYSLNWFLDCISNFKIDLDV